MSRHAGVGLVSVPVPIDAGEGVLEQAKRVTYFFNGPLCAAFMYLQLNSLKL